MTYEFPEELEFFERGFGYSSEYDHDEGQFSFLMNYDTGEKLIFSHSPFGNNSVNIKLFHGTEIIFHAYKEDVTNISFQAWNGEQVLRVYISGETNNFLIHFSPKPRLKYIEPTM